MGSLVSMPVSAAASCLGGCSAICCGKLLESGSVGSDSAARAVLLWLQFFAAALALLVTIKPESWLGKPCGDILKGVGICACEKEADVGSCYATQLTYRVQGAAASVFVLLLLLVFSGCRQGAARSFIVLKFFLVFLLGFAFLFVPNDVFDVFGSVAAAASAVFLVPQAVLVIDFAYSWNERWYSNSIMAQRSSPGSGVAKRWQVLILVSAALLLLGSFVGDIVLLAGFPDKATAGLVVSSLVAMLILLFFSVTDWCEHGAILTSAVVTAYTLWLTIEALSAAPEVDLGSPMWLRVLELLACVATLAALSAGASSARTVQGGGSGGGVGASTVGEGRMAARLEAGGTTESEAVAVDGKAFGIHCAVHAAAALYICSALAPAEGSAATFSMRCAALAVAILLYGWSLAAPKVLTGRSF